jgi:hypothetical protein
MQVNDSHQYVVCFNALLAKLELVVPPQPSYHINLFWASPLLLKRPCAAYSGHLPRELSIAALDIIPASFTNNGLVYPAPGSQHL